MTTQKDILKIVPGVMSLGVLGSALKTIPKNPFVNKNPKSKPVNQPKKLVKGFADIIIGTALIKPVADLIEGM